MAVFISAHLMKESNLFIDKEGVWDPYQPDVLSSHDQLLQILRSFKRQSGVSPELPEVHVKGEVHELLGELADAENVESDPDGDGRTSVVRANPPIVSNLT